MYFGPIKTVDQAKKFFKSLGCSHFYMWREYTDRYEEYKLLNISDEMEAQWREEELDNYYNRIMDNTHLSSFWSLHDDIAHLVRDLKTVSALAKMLEVTQAIRNKVPYPDRVLVAETINGREAREHRSGLIYLAYQLNELSVAKSFVELSLHFSACNSRGSQIDRCERCEKAAKLCHDIKLELGL